MFVEVKAYENSKISIKDATAYDRYVNTENIEDVKFMESGTSKTKFACLSFRSGKEVAITMKSWKNLESALTGAAQVLYGAKK